MTRIFTMAAAVLLSGLLLAGCTDRPAPQDGDAHRPQPESFIGRQVAESMAEARRKLDAESIRIDGNAGVTINGRSYRAGSDANDLPRAEITPDGELVIAGETIPATPGQRELLLDYRGHLIGLAQAGMEVGIQGADIAGSALGGIGEALFGGEQGRKAYEARIRAEAERVKQEALKLCTLLPPMLHSQQALAASLPAFAPYATMRQEDVDDCASNISDAITADAEA